MDQYFDLISYFLFARNRSPFDDYLYHLEDLINAIERSNNATSLLYTKDFDDEIEKSQKIYKEEQQKLSAKYWELYHEYSGSEYEKDAYAHHYAGYAHLDSEDQNNYMELSRQKDEMHEYFNRSALAMTYLTLESQFRRCCYLLQKMSNERLEVDDLDRRDYLLAMFNYLEKVINIPTKTLAQDKSLFDDLRYLRNKIMHSGGEFPDASDAKLKRIIDSSQGMLRLEKERIPEDDYDEPEYEHRQYKLVVGHISYLDRYYAAIKAFFNELFWLADARFSHAPLGQRLRFIIAAIENEVVLERIVVSSLPKGRQINAELVSKTPSNEFNLRCKITILKFKTTKISVTNQVADFVALDRLVAYIQSRPEIIQQQLLQGFNLGSGGLDIRILFS